HVTTAHDLALIMQYALSLPAFIEISRTPYYFFEDHPFEDGTEKWATNRNNCLGEDSTYYYEYLYSGKTGYTPEANHTYTAAAKKDDQLLVGAFLNGVDKAGFYTSVGELFNWGFENFQTKKIISKGDTLDEYILDDNTTIPLLATEDIYYTSSSNITTINTSVEYTNKDFSTTSIRKGDILFNASLLVNGESYKNIDLSSGITREYTTEVQLQQAIEKVTKKKSFIPRILTVFIIIILLLVLLILRIRYVKRRRSFLKRRHKIRKKHNF
ncbi:MAG: D-alanyl-D-alanine carboxypeptidase, partial [Clostridium celatum]|nr:D-alanyl-D-alanine carboxypeptidase [Clostridium celatum]